MSLLWSRLLEHFDSHVEAVGTSLSNVLLEMAGLAEGTEACQAQQNAGGVLGICEASGALVLVDCSSLH